MILDKRTQLCAALAVTVTAIATDQIDLKGENGANTLTDIGSGRQLYAHITVDETVTASGAATVVFSVESDSTANLATSPTTHAATGAIGKAALTAGKQIRIALPPEKTYERYLGLRFTVGTGPLTAGSFTVEISPDLQLNVPFKGAPL